MSTFLVSFGVVAATIAAVVYVVLNGPDQPATVRRDSSAAKAKRRRKAEARTARRARAQAASSAASAAAATVAPASPPRAAMPLGATPALALPDSDVMRLRVLPANRTTIWVRIRSFVVLVILVALLGALLALAIGGAGLGLALLIRSATG